MSIKGMPVVNPRDKDAMRTVARALQFLTGAESDSDRVMMRSEIKQLVAELISKIPEQPATTTTQPVVVPATGNGLTLLSNSVVNGVNTLSTGWDQFQELVFLASAKAHASDTGVSRQSTHHFYAEIIVPSDSTTEFQFQVDTGTDNRIYVNFRLGGTVYVDSSLDDDLIVAIYGRFPVSSAD